MKIRSLLLATALSMAGSAFAAHCPADMKQIDEALKTVQLTSEDLASVKKYRAEGEDLHKAGKHGQSVEVLDKALKILKLR